MPVDATSQAWRGRQRHAQQTSVWLAKAKSQCLQWPQEGLSERALIGLLDALPELARRDQTLFDASVNVLKAQTLEAAWARSLNHRLAMVRWAVKRDCKRNWTVDAFALAVRRDSWRATRDAQGDWILQDGRFLSRFLNLGAPGRKESWRAAIDLPGVVAIEIPRRHLDGLIWANVFQHAHRWLLGEHPALIHARARRQPWKLAVRRIHGAGFRGVFDPITQTVVVDPRHPNTLFHELAHWVLGHACGTDAYTAERDVEALLEQTDMADEAART